MRSNEAEASETGDELGGGCVNFVAWAIGSLVVLAALVWRFSWVLGGALWFLAWVVLIALDCVGDVRARLREERKELGDL